MFDETKVKLGIAPIAWTNDDLPELGGANTFEQCVSEMALAGYSGSEVGNKYPKNPEELNKALKLRNLTICNAWFSSFLVTKPLQETVDAFTRHCDFLYAVGARVIGVSEQSYSIQGLEQPVLGPKPVFTDAEWARLAAGLNELGEIAKQKGMTLTYHHHMGTGVQTAEEIDRLMAMTDPELVYLLFDTGHLSFAWEDAQVILAKYIQRIKHVHLKDIRPEVLVKVGPGKWSFLKAVREGVFTVPGDGGIDFAPLFAILDANRYQGWLVVEAEQDPAKANPLEYALNARNYIRTQTGL